MCSPKNTTVQHLCDLIKKYVFPLAKYSFLMFNMEIYKSIQGGCMSVPKPGQPQQPKPPKSAPGSGGK
jgi:hypothetical protein